MAKKWHKYILHDGDELVYYGRTTQELEERKKQHKRDGLIFTRMDKVGNLVSKESAIAWENKSVKDYCLQYGRNPRYNDLPKCKKKNHNYG